MGHPLRVSAARSCGLVVFDLEGALLRGPTVCELFAEQLGRREAMREFEQRRKVAEIAAARVKMARWYAGVPRTRLLRALDGARFADGAHEAIALLQEHGVACAIASITWDFAVDWFAERLGVEHCLGTGIRPSGAIVHVWPEDKGEFVSRLAARLELPRERTAAVGNPRRDASMFRAAELGYDVGEPESGVPAGAARGADLREVARDVLVRWA